MKSITDLFKAHIQGEVTTVCTCILIVRRDGASFGLTDHDEVLTVAGARYLPFDSFSRMSISNTCDLEVDGLEINGILNSDAVARIDVGSGLFDFATVDVMLVNWSDTGPNMGVMTLRRGWIGEIEMNEDNSFHAEIRGLSQVLSYRIGTPYAPECDADLGDKRCKLGLDPDFWKGKTPYREGDFIIGHITAPGNYVVADIVNNDFSDDSPPVTVINPTGWTTYGDDQGRWRISSNYGGLGSPPGHVYYASFVQVDGSSHDITELGMYQDVGIEDSGLDLDDVDLGTCRISATVYLGRTTDKGRFRFRIFSINDAGDQKTIYDTQGKQYAEDRWITYQIDDLLIPTGARQLRVDVYCTKKASDADGVMFGGIEMNLNDPDGTFNSDDLASGVMFQAQNSGVTGNTEPVFSNSIGTTYVDGGVTWKCLASFKTVTTVTAVINNQTFSATLPGADGDYDGGFLEWETGSNAGRGIGVKLTAGGDIQLIQRTFYPIHIGDRFVIHLGCDKTKNTCITKFNNYINFRGFPDVPGTDAYIQTPNAPSD